MIGSVGARRIAAILLVAAAFGFLGVTIAENWRQLSRFDWRIEPLGLGLSMAMLIAVFVWGVFVWSRVLARFPSADVPFRTLLRIWFLSTIARYIPGKIWQFVAAGRLARDAGVSTPLLLTSMVVQIGFTLLAAVAIATATVPLDGNELSTRNLWMSAIALLVAIALVHPRVLNFGLGLIPRFIHRDALAWDGSWADGVVLVVLSVISWLVYGFTFFIFVDAIVAVPLSAVLVLTGANALSFAAGYVFFIAPAGLGIREAALALLLAPFASPGVAAVIAILSRLWIIAAEIGGALLTFTLPVRRGVQGDARSE